MSNYTKYPLIYALNAGYQYRGMGNLYQSRLLRKRSRPMLFLNSKAITTPMTPFWIRSPLPHICTEICTVDYKFFSGPPTCLFKFNTPGGYIKFSYPNCCTATNVSYTIQKVPKRNPTTKKGSTMFDFEKQLQEFEAQVHKIQRFWTSFAISSVKDFFNMVKTK